MKRRWYSKPNDISWKSLLLPLPLTISWHTKMMKWKAVSALREGGANRWAGKAGPWGTRLLEGRNVWTTTWWMKNLISLIFCLSHLLSETFIENLMVFFPAWQCMWFHLGRTTTTYVFSVNSFLKTVMACLSSQCLKRSCLRGSSYFLASLQSSWH